METLRRSRLDQPSRFYHPELDLLRFFAFLMVFCRHLIHFHGFPLVLSGIGAFGVQIFFLLSAYLIVSLLMKEREKTGTINVWFFAARRILRIWPLYFAAIFAAYFLGLLSPQYSVPLGMVGAFLSLVGNIYVSHHGWLATPIVILWSISIEEQFYLIIPTLVKFRGTTAIRNACWLSLLAAYVELALLSHRRVSPHLGIFVNSLVEFQFFAAGGLIAIYTSGRKLTFSLPTRFALLASGAFLLYCAVEKCSLEADISVNGPKLIIGYAALLTACILIFFSFLDATNRSVPGISYFGKISYGLYVFHSWVLLFVFFSGYQFLAVLRENPLLGDVVALVGTLGVATLSYQLFESKALLLKKRFELVSSRSV